MPIEFRCGQCGKLLRTGDETVGRQAQCPECGALTRVPAVGASAGSALPLAPLGSQSSASASGSPFGSASAANVDPSGVPAAQRVSGPATALIVTAILTIVLQSLAILHNLIRMAVGPILVFRGGAEIVLSGGIGLAMGVVGLGISAVVLVGAMKMKNLENYPLAMTSAIISVIPCFMPCCLGVPFGIWALVVLSDSSVKAAFRG
jgi:hypothetical protein